MRQKLFLIFISLYFLPALSTFAQSSAWVDMFSYLKVKHLQSAGQLVYAQSENAFFTYNNDSGELEKISTVNGLSGDLISNFYYHKDLKKLFIFHEGGLIEVMDAQKNIFRSPELAYNSFIPTGKKIVNNIFADGNWLYLATEYGLSVYNLERNEFGDTYYFNGISGSLGVKGVAVVNQKIYAATVEGLFEANISDNLIDQNVWTKIDNDSWTSLSLFNQKLIGIKNQNHIVEINNSGIQNRITFNDIIKFTGINDYLTVGFNNYFKTYDQNFVLKNSYHVTAFSVKKFLSATDLNGNLFVGTDKHGIVKIDLNSSGYETIAPNCPLSNHAYSVDARENILWLAYGDINVDASFNPYPLFREGLSSYQNKAWLNIPYDDFQISDISFVKINPTNTNEVYFSSAFNGLIRIRNNQIDKIFNQTNSPLSITSTEDNSVRVFAIDFDSKNNLWVSHTPAPALVKHKPDDTWEIANLPNLLNSFEDNHGMSDLVVGKQDIVYLATEKSGLVVYNSETHQTVSLKEGLQESAYPDIQTIAIDKDDVMWVGNRAGLRILNNPEKIFENPDMEFKPIKIVYEGAVQLLMEGQNITKIVVDGSNNKWLATLGSGVYYYNEDGTRMIYHFTKENSPLPSNDIYDIAVDGSNGMVYFATLNGLTGYKGFATEGGENMDDVYAFPNPANEKEHQFVSIRGLIKDVNVKIVDIEGNLVYETVSKGGSIQWDLTAFGKYKVATGVYIALISNEDGTKTQTTKILVIK